VRLDFSADPNANIAAAEEYLRAQHLSRESDNLVIISDTQ
jgi:hypothetical protein